MKRMKKMFAFVLIMAMVLGMSVTAFATNTEPTASSTPTPIVKDYPSNEDWTTVTITGLEGITENTEINLYQIAKAVYMQDTSGSTQLGLKEYEWKTDVLTNQGDTPNLTSAKIAQIANLISGQNGSSYYYSEIRRGTSEYQGKYDDTKKEYTCKIKAGVYIAIISGATDAVYNPILLTATYGNTLTDDEEGTLEGGNVNLVGGGSYLNGLSAVAKKTSAKIDKDITTGSVADSSIPVQTKPASTHQNLVTIAENKDTASLNETVNYSIQPNPMPSYPAEAVNKTFFITDQMTEGLTFNYSSLEVSLKNADGSAGPVVSRQPSTGSMDTSEITFTIDSGAKTIARAVKDENGFKIAFQYNNLIYGNDGAVYVPTVTYSGTVNEKAEIGKVGNLNTAILYYANNPNTAPGSNFEPDNPTSDPTKGKGVGSTYDQEVVYTYKLAVLKTDDTSHAPLKGAIFGVYSDAACSSNKEVCRMTSDNNGIAISSQLRAGTYYVKEIQAPAGYSLTDTMTTIDTKWTTATCTVTTTTTTMTETSWTTDVNEAGANATQIGWVKSGELLADGMNAYTNEEEAEADGAVPAYEFSREISTTSNSVVTENPTAGNGLVYLKDNSPITIVNTKLSALPSTGGIGTTIFTLGGCVIMIIAAGLYFATRRRTAK